MEVVICRDSAQVGVIAAERVADRLSGKETPVLGLATGSSPVGLYEHLARQVAAGELDLGSTAAFALDEYVGLDYTHPESYHDVVRRMIVEPLGMDPALVNVPEGLADDLVAACEAYEAAIEAAGGIDVQILGIGANGHIGFNEPFTSFGSATSPIVLTARTRKDNARFFGSLDQVPTHALTQGLGTILKSRAAVLIATGAAKADAIAGMLGPVSVRCPASILQFHTDVLVVIDEAAAGGLPDREHFTTV